MIRFDFQMPDVDAVLREAMAEVEKDLTEKVRPAAVPFGGVAVKVEREADGTLKTINLQGTEAAIEAAQAALNC
ncbi:hypothetical protein [Rubrivivax gelatinosus]|uniref:Uncharacterized protein n=1 Tax=Rubrivivax gelatinosus TaxID=28068 RepID=A0A4R2MQQ7_RUBGE|nr:hypothetical protein [Rubrivivax gelatinosus]MBK1688235.1 hypothetical protein [Rubrivivax gelatinosus]TCP05506.1 hypothetical protein EV684_101378 [Rubrivivax gelatinosus]